MFSKPMIHLKTCVASNLICHFYLHRRSSPTSSDVLNKQFHLTNGMNTPVSEMPEGCNLIYLQNALFLMFLRLGISAKTEQPTSDTHWPSQNNAWKSVPQQATIVCFSLLWSRVNHFLQSFNICVLPHPSPDLILWLFSWLWPFWLCLHSQHWLLDFFKALTHLSLVSDFLLEFQTILL